MYQNKLYLLFYVLLTVHLDNLVMKTNLMHYLSSIYFVKQPLHVSGGFIAHHQEVFTVCVRGIRLN
jgi:hypothetical protein